MKRRAGFTLLEVLVAVAVFSVMAVLAYEGLRNFLAGRAFVEARAASFSDRIRAVSLLEQDFTQLAPRPVRDELGDPLPAVRARPGEAVLVGFSRRTPWTAVERGLPDLRRVEYRLEKGVLIRREWDALDRVAAVTHRDRPVLDGLTRIGLRFSGSEGWQEFWPATEGPGELARLPRAVGVTLEFEDGRSIERLFLVGGPG